MHYEEVRRRHLITPPVAWNPARQGRSRAALRGSVAVLTIFLVLTVASFDNAVLLPAMLTCIPLLLTFVVTAYYFGLVPWRRDTSGTQVMPLKSESPNALLIPYVGSARRVFYAMMISVMLPLVAAPAIADRLPANGGWRDSWIQTWAPFMPILAVFPAAMLLSVFVRKRSQLGLGLSSGGIYRWSWLGCRFVSWNWVDRIKPRSDVFPILKLHVTEPRNRTRNDEENLITRSGMFRKRDDVFVALLCTHPAVAYYALHYYHRHPEKRDELGTDAAVDRMRRLDFPDIIAEIKRYGDVRPR